MQTWSEAERSLVLAIVDASPDAMMVVDPEGLVHHANAQVAALFGYQPADLVGRPVEVLMPERFRDRHRRHWGELGVHPTPVIRPNVPGQDFFGLHSSGTEIAVEVSLSPVELTSGGFVLAAVRDVGDRHRREEHFRKLLDAAPDAILVLDGEETILTANHQAAVGFGYTADELVGAPMALLVPEGFRGAALSLGTAPGRETGISPLNLGIGSGRRKDGSHFPAELTLSPVHTDQGLRVCVAVRDVADRLTLQEESARIREELVATVSHELRTPLTSIVGYTEILMDMDPEHVSPDARAMLEVIERNAGRELRLVDDLLTIGLIRDDLLVVEPAPVSLGSAVRGVFEEALMRSEAEHLRLVLDVADIEPVLGDGLRLVQVVENLVGNAIKFTPAGGRVEVRVHDDRGMALLEVRDTGVGIEPDELPRIFDRLYRSPSSVVSQAQGAGLGLTIVEAIVEAHDGTIEVLSTPGVGSAFRVRLPYAA